MKKITESNYPILGHIYNSRVLGENYEPNLKWEYLSQPDIKFKHKILNAFNLYKESLQYITEIDYLVEHLFHKIDSDEVFRQKCFQVVSELPTEVSGVILFPFAGGAYLYHIAEVASKKLMTVFLLQENKLLAFEVCELKEVVALFMDKSFSVVPENMFESGTAISFVVTFLIFKYNAEINSVNIERGNSKRTKVTHLNQEYESQSRVPVQIIDSRWFTEVTGDGFKVSGHWRKQPYKSGEKKLIWIKDYEKQGYTRKALIEKIYE